MKNKTLRRIVREGWHIRFPDKPCPRIRKIRGGKRHHRRLLRACEWSDKRFREEQKAK